MSNLPHTSYVRRPLYSAFGISMLVVFSSAAGFLVSFLYRDIFFGVAKTFDVFNCENGFNSFKDFLVALGIAITVTFFAAFVILFAYRFGHFNDGPPTVNVLPGAPRSLKSTSARRVKAATTKKSSSLTTRRR